MRWRRLALVTVAVMTLMITACGGDDDAGSSGPGDAGNAHPTGQGPVPGASPDESAHEALSRIYSWEPVSEAHSGVAVQNALPWLSGEMALAASRPADDRMRPMRQWASWRAERAIVAATVNVVPVLDRPGRTAHRQASVLQQIQRADGSVDVFSLATYDVELELGDDACWRVWRIQIIESQPLTDGVFQ